MQKYTYTAIVPHILAYEIMQSVQLVWKFYVSISKFFKQRFFTQRSIFNLLKFSLTSLLGLIWFLFSNRQWSRDFPFFSPNHLTDNGGNLNNIKATRPKVKFQL